MEDFISKHGAVLWLIVCASFGYMMGAVLSLYISCFEKLKSFGRGNLLARAVSVTLIAAQFLVALTAVAAVPLLVFDQNPEALSTPNAIVLLVSFVLMFYLVMRDRARSPLSVSSIGPSA